MAWYSALAIYLLFWVVCAFAVLPWGIRTHEELGIDKVEGQDDGAPANFRPWRVIGWTTLVSSALFGLFYLNYMHGWIGQDFLDFIAKPPSE